MRNQKFAENLVSPPPLGEVPSKGGRRGLRAATFLVPHRPGKTLRCFPSFFQANAHKVKFKVEAFLKKSFTKKLYSCYRLACSYSAITVTNRAFTSPPQRWPWGMVGLK